MRQKWIDFLRAMAIIAVVQNHLPQTARLYNVLFSVFSVSLFILLAGVTAAISLKDKPVCEYRSYLLKKSKRILLPYLAATCGYVFFELGYIDVSCFFRKAVLFSEGSNGHMYFLVFYLELMLIAPVLVRLYTVCEKRELLQFLLLVSSAVLSRFFRTRTCLDIYGSASRYLFGGNYFFLFNLGIYSWFHLRLLGRKSVRLAVSFSCVAVLGYIMHKKWYLEWWSNPPVGKIILYTFCLFILGYCVVTLLQDLSASARRSAIFDRIMAPFVFIGRHSFYIYLWHMILVDLLAQNGAYNPDSMTLAKKILISVFILYAPCILFVLYSKIKKRFLSLF